MMVNLTHEEALELESLLRADLARIKKSERVNYESHVSAWASVVVDAFGLDLNAKG